MATNVVATSQPLAAQAGLGILREGGNAVDAALAAAIALTVLEPTGNGIGSDAFAQIWDTRALHGINGSGRSPSSWSFERFAHLDEMPEYGWDSVTVPGAVSVWAAMSKRFGKLPFEQLFGPAMHYADDGFPVSPIIAERWELGAVTFQHLSEFSRVFLPGGRAPSPGDLFCFKDVVSTLEEIAQTAGESFYRGNLARAIADCASEQGGAMAYDDLASHQPQWVKPISQSYRGRTIHELPPNGQGIAALIALGILEHFDVRQYPVDSVDSIHLQVEAMKLAFSDVSCHVADSEAMCIDFRDMIDPGYLQQRACQIDMTRSGSPETGIENCGGTVYLAAADSDGMMVSYIQSNFKGFGSGVVVPGTGITLNNRGHGFRVQEGHANCVAGGKKPYHTIIPGFVMHDGQPLMAFGVMGAHMQAQGHVQMVTRMFDYGQNPQAASDAPRWHVMDGNGLALEKGFSTSVIDGLEGRGHQIITGENDIFGGAQLILKSGNHYIAGSDHRKDGQAVGY